MSVLDYGEIESVINKVESVFDNHKLTLDEREVVLKFINERILARRSKQRANDMIGDVSIGGLMSRFMKHQDDDKTKE